MTKSLDQPIRMLFADLITQGFHAVIVESAGLVTAQPLTQLGRDAIRRLLAGAPDDVLQRFDEEKRGYYAAASPLQGSPEQIASVLVRDHGLPAGSVAIYRAHA